MLTEGIRTRMRQERVGKVFNGWCVVVWLEFVGLFIGA